MVSFNSCEYRIWWLIMMRMMMMTFQWFLLRVATSRITLDGFCITNLYHGWQFQLATSYLPPFSSLQWHAGECRNCTCKLYRINEKKNGNDKNSNHKKLKARRYTSSLPPAPPPLPSPIDDSLRPQFQLIIKKVNFGILLKR